MNTPSKKIVIFDDDEDILSICSYILEEQGWEVHTFSDCNNIVEKVSGILPDVIMMDNWIPDSGGIIATQTLKKTEGLKEIPVIYFSANSDIQILANHAGAQSYLAKPFDLEDLEKVINRVIAA
ncbi:MULTISPECIES: response regulator [Mucilaginibacter]|jgi:two-component system cell cycle response regulator DivK|uniref:Response regulator n=2 Tax=Mucilaginibacter TaxID=423349 RepID=A0AAE6JLC3_9SPHI|nr:MULTISPECIES: response regulator [Mucilaginibacter]NVM64638.1 two-component system cell cycle response regulator DivK [Mucilaginibacter sp. SG538B]QEM06900.1 response regulator [Mucilaginibacter rubeus]QEM19489.1 response regulator [Mucilaginibacter gossypii]QTE35597.1 response regulator [Mucilaginibacter gossypii]QTE43962.1 response regulator [Mucilaginibacter rubeus]